MSKYIVKDVVCDTGIYSVDNEGIEELVEVCNSRANALKICEILNDDLEHKVYKDEQITDLEAKLAESEERINWLVEAEFNRKWAKKYVEMRRKEDPMLCLPDSDEVYEKYFELKQQLADKEEQLNNSEQKCLICNKCQENEQLKQQLADMQKEKDELISKYRYYRGEYNELKQQLAEKDTRIEELESQFAYECECNKQFVECQNENEMLKQQLAEKDKEIEELKDYIGCKGCIDLITKLHQNEISFAVDILEELSDCSNYIDSKLDFECGSYVSEKAIRDKIKYLKGKKDE